MSLQSTPRCLSPALALSIDTRQNPGHALGILGDVKKYQGGEEPRARIPPSSARAAGEPDSLAWFESSDATQVYAE